jgi:hypothetical protein
MERAMTENPAPYSPEVIYGRRRVYTGDLTERKPATGSKVKR